MCLKKSISGNKELHITFRYKKDNVSKQKSGQVIKDEYKEVKKK